MRVFNISAMHGDRERSWRVVWGQSAVPAFAGIISAPKPLSLLRATASAIFAAIRRAAPFASGGSERSPDELGPYLATFAPNHFVAALFA